MPIVLNIIHNVYYRVRRLIFTNGLELANNTILIRKVCQLLLFIVDECAVLCIVMNVRLLITLLLRINFFFANYNFFCGLNGKLVGGFELLRIIFWGWDWRAWIFNKKKSRISIKKIVLFLLKSPPMVDWLILSKIATIELNLWFTNCTTNTMYLKSSFHFKKSKQRAKSVK